MITFVSSTFRTATLQQRNALFSWREAGVPYILAGSTDDLGARLTFRGVKTEENLGFKGDSPLVNDMMAKALLFANTPLIALINADIVIEPDFLGRLKAIVDKYGTEIFMTSVRRDTEWDASVGSREDILKVTQSPWTWHQDASSYNKKSL